MALTKKVRKGVIKMARTTYQIVLSTDGTHKLTASTDDPIELKNAMDHLKNAYGWMEYFIQQGELHKIKDVVTSEASKKQAASADAPVCAVHKIAMNWIDKNGGFWSCHKKNDDGSWCNYRPGKATA
jgi:hypothetical protein